MTQTQSATAGRETNRRRILVGVDDSPEARAAAAYAADVAAHVTGSELLLAHAYETWPEGTNDPAVDQLRARTHDEAAELVEKIAEELRETSRVPITTVISTERPGPMLGRLAQESRMVVVGQDTAGLLDRLAFGSVAAHLAATAPCPVAVVPAPWHRKQFGFHPVVVAVSGEGMSPATLAAAFDEAEHTGTEVLALHAMPYFASAEEAERHQRDLTEIVTAAQRHHPGINVQTMLVRGAPDEHLVKQSVNACAAFVGRPERTGLTSWLRSVAHAVVKRTHCPLIVVPAG
ncbi:MAG TPA: universal stress protein [Microlunatus sp.]|nr:universal stress protein [Microlunatus sp.]